MIERIKQNMGGTEMKKLALAVLLTLPIVAHADCRHYEYNELRKMDMNDLLTIAHKFLKKSKQAGDITCAFSFVPYFAKMVNDHELKITFTRDLCAVHVNDTG